MMMLIEIIWRSDDEIMIIGVQKGKNSYNDKDNEDNDFKEMRVVIKYDVL